MKAAVVYCQWAVRRRFRLNIPAYVSLAIVSTMAFISIALNGVSSKQLSGLATGADYAGQLKSASSVLFLLGIVVSTLQTGILVSRLIRERADEFGLLSSIGLSRSFITLLATLEYLVHAAIGVGFGIVANCVLAMALILTAEGHYEPKLLILAVCFSAIVPILAVLPIPMLVRKKYKRSGSTIHG